MIIKHKAGPKPCLVVCILSKMFATNLYVLSVKDDDCYKYEILILLIPD